MPERIGWITSTIKWVSSLNPRQTLKVWGVSIIMLQTFIIVKLLILVDKRSTEYKEVIIKCEFEKAQNQLDFYKILVREAMDIREKQIKRKERIDTLKLPYDESK